MNEPMVRDCQTCGNALYRNGIEGPCKGCVDFSKWEVPQTKPPTATELMRWNEETLARFAAKEQRALAAQTSDGSTASYYELPSGAAELQDLIAYRNMNAQMGEIFRACYRYGQVAHSPKARDLKKIIFYAQAELDRLAKYEGQQCR